MASKKQADKQAALQNFCNDLYYYIWSHYTFEDDKTKEEFAEIYGPRLEENDKKDIFFTDDIGNAVRVSMFLLRDYFHGLFLFTFPSAFKQDFKLMWSNWTEKRNNVFIKIIDTLAIVAEAFLYSNSLKKSDFKLSDINDWFIELFDEHLAEEFYKRGGWKQLNIHCLDCYAELFRKLNYKTMLNHSTVAMLELFGCCKIINLLRNSVVSFPILAVVFCSKCQENFHKDDFKKIVYLRLKQEMIEAFKNEENTEKLGILMKVIIRNYFESAFSEEEKVSLKNYELKSECFSLKYDRNNRCIQVSIFGKVFFRKINSKCIDFSDIKTSSVRKSLGNFSDWANFPAENVSFATPEHFHPKTYNNDEFRVACIENILPTTCTVHVPPMICADKAKLETSLAGAQLKISEEYMQQASPAGALPEASPAGALPEASPADALPEASTEGAKQRTSDTEILAVMSNGENVAARRTYFEHLLKSVPMSSEGFKITEKTFFRADFLSKFMNSISTEIESDEIGYYLISRKYSNKFNKFVNKIIQCSPNSLVNKPLIKYTHIDCSLISDSNINCEEDINIIHNLKDNELPRKLLSSTSDINEFMIVSYEMPYVLIGKVDQKKSNSRSEEKMQVSYKSKKKETKVKSVSAYGLQSVS